MQKGCNVQTRGQREKAVGKRRQAPQQRFDHEFMSSKTKAEQAASRDDDDEEEEEEEKR
jgi:hypothetical protein